MAIYSIGDLEKLCGIKAHTIRIWEQRYGIVKPQRTKTNIRYYQDQDLKRLLNIAVLNKNGFKISRIAQMDEDEIKHTVRSISEVNFDHNTQLDALTISMIELDESKFDRIIRSNISQIGFERTMLEVIYPFLDKLSVLWLTGSINPVQESFMSLLIRQKLIASLDALEYKPSRQSACFMLYLPKGESQELSLLFLNYLLRSRGHKVIYLGTNISIDDLTDAYSVIKPDYFFTMITESYTNQSVGKYLDKLTSRLPDSSFLVSGYQIVAQGIKASQNIKPLAGLSETLQFLEQFREK